MLAVLNESLPTLHEKDVVLVASKVVAIHQGKCLHEEDVADKDQLVYDQADSFVPKQASKYGVILTKKENTLCLESD